MTGFEAVFGTAHPRQQAPVQQAGRKLVPPPRSSGYNVIQTMKDSPLHA
jgi:hypothetical protein